MNKYIKNFVIYFIAIIILLFSLFPVYWMILTSIKRYEDLLNPYLFITKITFENYIKIISSPLTITTTINFYRCMTNSIIIALGSVILSLSISILLGYGLARMNFKFKRLVSNASLFVYILPPSFLAIPFFVHMRMLGLVNSLISVILAETIFTIPFCAWILREQFSSIPKEIEESAYIDGCGRLEVLFRIILPLSAPTLVATATYIFIRAWNEYQYALLLLYSKDLWTLPLFLTTFLAADVIPWGILMAASVLYTIPPLIFYYVTERYMIKGLIAGAVKA